jgi:hypothetical protein
LGISQQEVSLQEERAASAEQRAIEALQIDKIRTVLTAPPAQQGSVAKAVGVPGQLEGAPPPSIDASTLAAHYDISAADLNKVNTAQAKGDIVAVQKILERVPLKRTMLNTPTASDIQAAVTMWPDMTPAEYQAVKTSNQFPNRQPTGTKIPPNVMSTAIALAGETNLDPVKVAKALMYPEGHPKEIEQITQSVRQRTIAARYKVQLDELEASRALAASTKDKDRLQQLSDEVEQTRANFFYECYGRWPLNPREAAGFHKLWRFLGWESKPKQFLPNVEGATPNVTPGVGATPARPKGKNAVDYNDAFKR